MIYAPLNKCMYCGDDKSPLTDEHIIPYSLTFKRMEEYILPESTCVECQKITSKIEIIVTRKMYWPYRVKYGYKSRHPKKVPKHFPVDLVNHDGSVDKVNIDAEKHPVGIIVLIFPEPGLITNSEMSKYNPEFQTRFLVEQDNLNNLLSSGQHTHANLKANVYWGDFCRMIAKISHGFVSAIIGDKGYIPFLPDIILGKNEFISHYVGGLSKEQIESQDKCARTPLEIYIQDIRGDFYIIVHLNLFLPVIFPTYQAVVGKIPDFDFFLKNSRKKT